MEQNIVVPPHEAIFEITSLLVVVQDFGFHPIGMQFVYADLFQSVLHLKGRIQQRMGIPFAFMQWLSAAGQEMFDEDMVAQYVMMPHSVIVLTVNENWPPPGFVFHNLLPPPPAPALPPPPPPPPPPPTTPEQQTESTTLTYERTSSNDGGNDVVEGGGMHDAPVEVLQVCDGCVSVSNKLVNVSSSDILSNMLDNANISSYLGKLASLADLYVNDVYRNAHIAHASTEAVTRFLSPSVAGFLMQKTQYRDLSDAVSSWSINCQLWILQNEIFWARVRWQSIQVPPFEEQFVNKAWSTRAEKEEEEVFIVDSVPKLSQDSSTVKPSRVTEATNTEEIVVAEEIEEKEASTTAVVKSIPSPVIDVCNSSDVELIPSDLDEIDDSLEVDLIPPFFFVEKEDVYPLDGMSLQLENECLNDFFFLHNKILGMACFHFKLDDYKLLFDRGKCASRLILRLLLSFGYKSDFSSMQSIHILCVNDAEVYDQRQLFVKIPDRNSIFTLVLAWMVKHREAQFVIMPENIACKLGRDRDSAGWIYDRGKMLGILKGYFSSVDTHKFGADANTSYELVLVGSIMIDTYTDEMVFKLVSKQGYQLLAHNDLLLQVKSGLYVKKRAMEENLLRHCCFAVCHLKIQCVQAYLSTSTAFSHGFHQMHLCISFLTKLASSTVYFNNKFGAEFFFLQLTCGLLEVIAVQFMCLQSVVESDRAHTSAHKLPSQLLQVLNSAADLEYYCCLPLWILNEEEDEILMSISAKLFHVKLLMVIVGGHGDVLQKVLLEFQLPCLLIRKTILVQDRHSNGIYSNMSYWVQYLNSCFHQLVGVYVCESIQYSPWGYKYLLTFTWQSLPNAAQVSSGDWFKVSAGIHEQEEVLLIVIQILNVFLRIEFLQWKLKLFFTGWLVNMFCEARIRHQIVATCVATLISVLVERLQLGLHSTSPDPYKTFQAIVRQPVPTTVRSQKHFWQLSPCQLPQLLTSGVFWKILLPVRVKWKVGHSGWSNMHLSFRVWSFPSGCNQVKALKYSTWKHQVSTESPIKMLEIPFLLTVILHGSTVENIAGIQVLLVGIRILHKLVRVEYLRWKFRFHYQPLMMILPSLRSCVQFLSRNFFLHYLLHASVIYGALTVLKKADMVSNSAVFVFLTLGHVQHACFCCSQRWYMGYQPMKGYPQLEFIVRIHFTSDLLVAIFMWKCTWIVLRWDLTANDTAQFARVLACISGWILTAHSVQLQDSFSNFDEQSEWICEWHTNSVFILIPDYIGCMDSNAASRSAVLTAYQALYMLLWVALLRWKYKIYSKRSQDCR